MSVKKREWKNKETTGTSYLVDVCHRTSRYREHFATEREARKKEAQVRLAFEAAERPISKKLLFGQVALRYLAYVEERVGNETYSPSHLRNRKSLIYNYIINDRSRFEDDATQRYVLDRMVDFGGGLGDMRLRDVKGLQLQMFLNELQAAGAEMWLVKKCKDTLHNIFTHAIKLGDWNGPNPVNAVKIEAGKKDRKPKILLPTSGNMRLFFSVADDFQTLYLLLSVVAAPRIGEVFCLRYSDLNYTAKTIAITKTVDQEKMIVETKTGPGDRDVPLGDLLISMIKQRAELLGCAMDDFIFADPTNGKMLVHQTFYDKIWKPLLSKATARQKEAPDLFEPLVPITPKSLRHLGISIWIEEGHSDMMLITYAGHSSISTINRTYGHIIANRDKIVRTNKVVDRVVALTEAITVSDFVHHLQGGLHEITDKKPI